MRNVWRLYGGWYDGNPAHLKPAPDAQLAASSPRSRAAPTQLARRAQELAAAGELRLACHLIELATGAAPAEPALHAARAAIYQQRRDGELSLMAKGIFGYAAGESLAKAGTFDPHAKR